MVNLSFFKQWGGVNSQISSLPPVLSYFRSMHRLALLLFSCSIAFATEHVRILRDEFGVPHIFAATPAGAAYGSGYAPAEDRLEEMMRNLPQSRRHFLRRQELENT